MMEEVGEITEKENTKPINFLIKKTTFIQKNN